MEKTRKGKKFLSMLMTFTMVTTLFTGMTTKASAVDAVTRTTPLDLKEETSVTYVNADGETTGNPTTSDITDSTEGWKWYINESASYDATAAISDTNHPAKTLILDGAMIDCSSVTDVRYALQLPSATTIQLVNTSNIKSGSCDEEGTLSSYGILGQDLTICGNGRLNVKTAEKPADSSNYSFIGICTEAGTVNIGSANDYPVINATGYDDGIYCMGISIQGGSVTAFAKDSSFGVALFSMNTPEIGEDATIMAGDTAPGTEVASYDGEKWVKIVFPLGGSHDVNGTYVAPEDTFDVDITWGAMDFTYTAPTYTSGTGTWAVTTDGGNKITVGNKSNVAIDAALSYAAATGGNTTANFKDATTETATTIDKLSLNASTAGTTETVVNDDAYLNITGGKISATGKIGVVTVTVDKQSVA